MDLHGKQYLSNCQRKHPDVRSAVSTWVSVVEAASWDNPSDIKKRFKHASFLANNVVVFNLRGNNYRLVAKVYYDQKTVIVTNIGTHAEYAKWNLG